VSSLKDISNIDEKFAEAMAQMPDWFRVIFGATDGFWEFIIRNSLQGIAIAATGWFVAWYLERRHHKHLDAREAVLSDVTLTTSKHAPKGASSPMLVMGSAVVSHDFFRTLFIQIRKIIGGNISHYERLTARGRREAFIRMREEAKLRGLDRVVNVRFGSSHVAGRFLPAVELTAYGTGVKTRSQ